MVALKKPKLKNLIDVCISVEDFKKLHMTEIENTTWIEVEFQGDVMGYAKAEDFRELNLDNPLNTDNVRIRNYGSEEFKSLFEHPLFQRRKPQLISAESLSAESELYYILKNGQKTGPFASHELHQMMDTRDLLPTDLVSVDHGQNYVKLFQIEGFDRRTLRTNHELPSAIKDSLVQRNKEEHNYVKDNNDTDAIASLAYLGQIKAGKMNDRVQEEKLEHEMKEKYTSYSKGMIFVFLAVVAFALFQMKSFFPLNFLSTKKPIGEQPEILEPVGVPFESNTQNSGQNNIENSGRNNIKFQDGNFQNRRINSVVPRKIKSFDQSSTFKNQRNENRDDTTTQFIEPADHYYDDNPAPIELDPVQSQVSKETYEPTEGEIKPQDSNGLFDQNIAN
ncbi:MAG: DUF4339 domain-containing protein [Bacteriovoracaceae bacterium]|nr:DUF4339 domain-containing protein [Bacteriovoracaceae bacterium]